MSDNTPVVKVENPSSTSERGVHRARSGQPASIFLASALAGRGNWVGTTQEDHVCVNISALDVSKRPGRSAARIATPLYAPNVAADLETSRARRTTAAVAMTILAVAWVVAIGVLLWQLFEVAMSSWAASYDGDLPLEEAISRAQRLDRLQAHWLLWLAAVSVGGPLLIAIVALAGRMRRMAVVFWLVVAGVLAVPAIAIAVQASLMLKPDSPTTPPRPPGYCVEYSGGDTRCPGG